MNKSETIFRKTVCLLLISVCLITTVLLSGCVTSSANQTPAVTTPNATTSPTPPQPSSIISAATQFGNMLAKVPYSFLQEHDIWFGDLEAAKRIQGIENADSLDALMKLTPDKRSQVSQILSGIAAPTWRNMQMAPAAGFDYFMIKRGLFTDTPPPWAFSLSEGNFDKDLIVGKLTEAGYQKVEYVPYFYYSLNDDFSVDDLSNPMTQKVLSAMNRVALLDNALITAPATEILTGILDTMAGKEASVLDSPAGRCLASSLGDVLSGVLMNPERTLNPNPPQEMPQFKFAVPPDWELLHQYEMTGIGFKTDGQERYWIVSLYYKNAEEAMADADILAKRMESYILNTRIEPSSFKPTPLIDLFEVGKPKVEQYSEGATLTVVSRYKANTPESAWQRPMIEFRDLLFLAPDPGPYLARSSTPSPIASQVSPQAALTLAEAQKQLEEKGYALADNAQTASALAGYVVATPAFIPPGFVPVLADGHAPFVIAKMPVNAPGASCQVSQKFAQSPDPGAPRGPSFALIQTPQGNLVGAGLLGEADIAIGGYSGKELIMQSSGDNPPRLALWWSDGTLYYDLEGELSGPLDEATLVSVAASVGVH
jgi:hypothetical protein